MLALAATRPTSGDRSKRQERVGQVVLTELSTLLHRGDLGTSDYLEGNLRQRISIVKADVSPDLRQARISVSIRDDPNTDASDAAMDKRRAYSWLVRNAKPLRHVLSKRMSHMKSSSPMLQFVRVDVAAAVDVMYLIDKVSKGNAKREGTLIDAPPSGVVGGIDFDEEFDEDEWDEDDDDFFGSPSKSQWEFKIIVN